MIIISDLFFLFLIAGGSLPDPPRAVELGVAVPVLEILAAENSDGESSYQEDNLHLVGFPVSSTIEYLPEAPVIPPDLKHRLWNGWKRSLIGRFNFQSIVASLPKLLQHREQIGYVVFAILLLINASEYVLPTTTHNEDLPYIIDLLAEKGVGLQTIINACTKKFFRTSKNISAEAAQYLIYEAITTVWTTVDSKQSFFLVRLVASLASLAAMGFTAGSIADSVKLSARLEMYESLKRHIAFLHDNP